MTDQQRMEALDGQFDHANGAIKATKNKHTRFAFERSVTYPRF